MLTENFSLVGKGSWWTSCLAIVRSIWILQMSGMFVKFQRLFWKKWKMLTVVSYKTNRFTRAGIPRSKHGTDETLDRLIKSESIDGLDVGDRKRTSYIVGTAFDAVNWCLAGFHPLRQGGDGTPRGWDVHHVRPVEWNRRRFDVDEQSGRKGQPHIAAVQQTKTTSSSCTGNIIPLSISIRLVVK